MGDAAREFCGTQGGMVRPIIATADPNIITMNGTTVQTVSQAGTTWQVKAAPSVAGTTTTYYPYEFEDRKPDVKTLPRIQTVTAAGNNVIDFKNVAPLPQAILSQVQQGSATWATTTTSSSTAPTVAVVAANATDATGWSTIKWENSPSTNVVQKASTINTAGGIQFVSAGPQPQQLLAATPVGNMNVLVHGGRKMGGTIIETFKCEVCNQVFQSMVALQHHVNTIHEVQSGPSMLDGSGGDSRNKTKLSPSAFKCEYKYSGRMVPETVISGGTLGVSAAAAAQIIGAKKEKRRNWQCDICLNRFSRKDHLSKHVSAVHEKIRPFVCTTCGKKFSQKHHLRAHILARHEDDKTAAKAFQCPQCAKRFTRNDHLERHVESVHEKRKQFECAVCAHQFARKHHLSKHILAVHAKVKPYGCHLCSESFLQRHHLGAHIMSVHQPAVHEEDDGSKSYVCSICSHRFKRRDHLRKHVETVHEKTRAYACQLCERRFGQKYHLAIHVSAVHEGKKPHECKLCSHRSARKSGLQRHMKTVHCILPTTNVTTSNSPTTLQVIDLRGGPQMSRSPGVQTIQSSSTTMSHAQQHPGATIQVVAPAIATRPEQEVHATLQAASATTQAQHPATIQVFTQPQHSHVQTIHAPSNVITTSQTAQEGHPATTIQVVAAPPISQRQQLTHVQTIQTASDATITTQAQQEGHATIQVVAAAPTLSQRHLSEVQSIQTSNEMPTTQEAQQQQGHATIQVVAASPIS